MLNITKKNRRKLKIQRFSKFLLIFGLMLELALPFEPSDICGFYYNYKNKKNDQKKIMIKIFLMIFGSFYEILCNLAFWIIFTLTNHKQKLHEHGDKTATFNCFWYFYKMWVNIENAIKNHIFVIKKHLNS